MEIEENEFRQHPLYLLDTQDQFLDNKVGNHEEGEVEQTQAKGNVSFSLPECSRCHWKI